MFITEKKDIFNLIIDYITDKNLNQIDIYLFYIRMLYPSFYFDKYEDVITLDDIDINSINNEEVIVLSRRYEKLLKRLYQFLSNYLLMPDIFWLK